MSVAAAPCILLLGGSFDPVHTAHVALAEHFIALLKPDTLRVIPAGNPWQKDALQASAEDRINMLERAFAHLALPVQIDQQEMMRNGPSYTVDTLRNIREEVGTDASLIFLLGADQLRKLNTWHAWQELFNYAHLAAASRPGYTLASDQLPQDIARAFAERTAKPEQLRHIPCGKALLSAELALDISATGIREALRNGAQAVPQLTPAVLDYIEQHHLYRN